MIGFNVTFYLFQYNEVVHPGVVTKVMGNVSQSKVGMFLVCFPIKGWNTVYIVAIRIKSDEVLCQPTVSSIIQMCMLSSFNMVLSD